MYIGQFYFHGRFDTSHGQPQCVHRFESVKYHGYNLFWNWNGDCKVTLKVSQLYNYLKNWYVYVKSDRTTMVI